MQEKTIVENLQEETTEEVKTETPKKKVYNKRGDILGQFHQGDKVSLKGLPFIISKVTAKKVVFDAQPFQFEVPEKVE